MNRPKIICHILQSVDGNIDGDFFSMPVLRPAFQAFARIREEYACDAVISGATTASEIYANSLAYDLPEAKETYPRTDWQAAKADKYAVIIDGEGTIHWESGMVERRGDKMHVITVLQENMSYQSAIGTCEIIIVDLRPSLPSITSKRSRHLSRSSSIRPKSSITNRSSDSFSSRYSV